MYIQCSAAGNSLVLSKRCVVVRVTSVHLTDSALYEVVAPLDIHLNETAVLSGGNVRPRTYLSLIDGNIIAGLSSTTFVLSMYVFP